MIAENTITSQRGTIETLFTECSPDAQRITVGRGENLIDQDSATDHMYFIHSGQVRLLNVGSNDTSHLFAILGAGNWIGCAALVGRPDFGFSAIAMSDVQVTKVPVGPLIDELKKNPDAMLAMIQELSELLCAAREVSANMVFDDCRDRLIKAMIRFSQTPAASREGDQVVLHMTHEQLAQAIGVARETVSLTITDLRKEDMVRTGRTQLIFDPIKLAHLLEHSSATNDRTPALAGQLN